MNEIHNIAVIGQGNVGIHLSRALTLAGKDVKPVTAREEWPASLTTADLILISVKDEFVEGIVRRLSGIIAGGSDLNTRRRIVAHTSGSLPLSVLSPLSAESGVATGVFYPMQTFTKGVEMVYDDIPFMIEASDSDALRILMNLASAISSNVMEADSDVRAKYHIGAVLTCNFANHLCSLADDFLDSEGLDFRYLLPLLRQTTTKLLTTSPRDAQTGPAVRGDRSVIDYHLNRLSDNPKLAKIYTLLSESIMDFHNVITPRKENK